MPGFVPPKRVDMVRLLALLVVALFVQACDVQEPGVDANTAAELSARAEIKEAAGQFSAAYVSGDIDSLLTFYTDDAVIASGNNDFIRGRAAFGGTWALPEGRTILCHATNAESLTVSGDHAYDWGYYDGQAAQDGEPLDPFYGKYVIVWKRGTDGRWRMALDVWSGVPVRPQTTTCA